MAHPGEAGEAVLDDLGQVVEPLGLRQTEVLDRLLHKDRGHETAHRLLDATVGEVDQAIQGLGKVARQGRADRNLERPEVRIEVVGQGQLKVRRAFARAGLQDRTTVSQYGERLLDPVCLAAARHAGGHRRRPGAEGAYVQFHRLRLARLYADRLRNITDAEAAHRDLHRDVRVLAGVVRDGRG